jgi:hypothetical protein
MHGKRTTHQDSQTKKYVCNKSQYEKVCLQGIKDLNIKNKPEKMHRQKIF